MKILRQFHFKKSTFMLGRQCRRPNDPRNGEVVSKSNNQDLFDPHQKVWFRCDRGFKLDGHKDFVCQDDGSWEPQPFPRCVSESKCFFFYYICSCAAMLTDANAGVLNVYCAAFEWHMSALKVFRNPLAHLVMLSTFQGIFLFHIVVLG